MKALFGTFLLCAMIGCKRAEKIPEDILPPDKMEKVMWDLVRADEFVSGYILPKDSTKNKKSESIPLYEKVFTLHGTNKEEFKRSFSWYRADPDRLRTLTDSLHKHMNATFAQPAEPYYSPDTVNKRIKVKEQ